MIAPFMANALTNQALTSPQQKPVAAPVASGFKAAPLAGAGLQVAGALEMSQGAREQQDAMQNALQGYGQQLGNFYGGQRAAGMQDINQADAISQQRMAALQQMVGQYKPQAFNPQAQVGQIQGAVQQARMGGPQLGDASMGGGAAHSLQNRLGSMYGQRQQQQNQVLGNQLAWGQQGVGQQQALGQFATADQDVQNRLAMMNRLAQIRGGADARARAQLEQDAQRRMAGSQGVGSGHMLTGTIMQGLGSIVGSGA